jgi:hypothetical protein
MWEQVKEKFKNSSFGVIWIVAAVLLVLLVVLAIFMSLIPTSKSEETIRNIVPVYETTSETKSVKEVTVSDSLEKTESDAKVKVYKAYIPDYSAQIDKFLLDNSILNVSLSCDEYTCYWKDKSKSVIASINKKQGIVAINISTGITLDSGKYSFTNSEEKDLIFQYLYEELTGVKVDFTVTSEIVVDKTHMCYTASRLLNGYQIISTSIYDQHTARICIDSKNKLTFAEYSVLEPNDKVEGNIDILTSNDAVNSIYSEQVKYSYLYDSSEIYKLQQKFFDDYTEFEDPETCEIYEMNLKYTIVKDSTSGEFFTFPLYVFNCTASVKHLNKDYLIPAVLFMDARK